MQEIRDQRRIAHIFDERRTKHDKASKVEQVEQNSDHHGSARNAVVTAVFPDDVGSTLLTRHTVVNTLVEPQAEE